MEAINEGICSYKLADITVVISKFSVTMFTFWTYLSRFVAIHTENVLGVESGKCMISYFFVMAESAGEEALTNRAFFLSFSDIVLAAVKDMVGYLVFDRKVFIRLEIGNNKDEKKN